MSEARRNDTSLLQYPDTPKREVTDTLHGEQIRDPYRWLEDETDPEVKQWVEQQNALAKQYFEGIDTEPVHQELLEDHDVFIRTAPIRRGDAYFWYERQPGQHHAVLFSADDPQGTNKRTIFDVNTLSEDGSVAHSFFNMSRYGSYAVYDTTEGGSERHQVYIRDMTTGEDEPFYFGRCFMASWRDDERGFYYVVSNYQEHGGDTRDEMYYQQVYFHRIGDKPEQDECIFDAIEHLPKEALLDVHDSDDDAYVGIHASIGAGDNEIYVYVINTQTNTSHELMKGFDVQTELRLMDGYAYVITNYQAENYRVLRTPQEATDTPIDEWEEFISQDPDRQLRDMLRTKREILVEYTYNATDQVDRIDRETGALIDSLDIPELASVGAIKTNRDDEDFYYSVATFFSPATQYHFHGDTGTSELFYEDPRSLDSEAYTAEQRWYTSKDGERIPMFLVAPKGYADSYDNPTVLSGYGGFNISVQPAFAEMLKPWLQRGGIVAKPCIRGGGEFGEAWHESGMRENKQNSFDDFISAAEYLIGENVTKPERLAILGGSNGGLLVGTSITQRPDLFQAAVCAVPLLDMYRYHNFLMAYMWTHEYGHPDNPDEFAWLRQYSPYHHVDDSQKYPNILLTAGINDTRVHPMHAWKMAAKLQNGHPDNIALVRTEMEAGHGPGKGFYQLLHDFAENVAFMMHGVGIDTTNDT